jgi:hypothetical protein
MEIQLGRSHRMIILISAETPSLCIYYSGQQIPPDFTVAWRSIRKVASQGKIEREIGTGEHLSNVYGDLDILTRTGHLRIFSPSFTNGDLNNQRETINVVFPCSVFKMIVTILSERDRGLNP